jgi:hypothetical protein
MKPLREKQFPVPANEFPVRDEKIPCSVGLREFASSALKLRTDSRSSHLPGNLRQRAAGIGARPAEKTANPQKFPVNFPVLREFEDHGRSFLHSPDRSI